MQTGPDRVQGLEGFVAFVSRRPCGFWDRSHSVSQAGLELMEAYLGTPRTRHHSCSLSLLHQTEKLTRREVEAKFCNLSLSSNSVSTFRWCACHCLPFYGVRKCFCSSKVASSTHLLLTDTAVPLRVGAMATAGMRGEQLMLWCERVLLCVLHMPTVLLFLDYWFFPHIPAQASLFQTSHVEPGHRFLQILLNSLSSP